MTVGPIVTQIRRQYRFEAAHFLPKVREGHKCKRVHGHNYLIEIVVEGRVDKTGFVIDFWDLDSIVKPLIEQLDHRCLNDIEGLENPTAEFIANWFLDRIDINGYFDINREGNARVVEVSVHETPDAIATVTRI